ncbi:ABC transporter B family member 28 isoform X2 [Beta vulgaris subsp. vulgaris]|nr:ABC transporter B family member 28 isoform X2 [Beta vulgaris subsp. vulgaris]
MAGISLLYPTLTRTYIPSYNRQIQSHHFPPFSLSSCHLHRTTRLRFSIPRQKWASPAYVPGPASDYSVTDPDPNVENFRAEKVQSKDAINWGIFLSLLMEQKWRLALCISALVGGTTCTLSMPLFSGRFFEVLSGTVPEPLWKIMSRIAVVYALEPIFTVIFVINMNKIWEKVMSVLRAQIFRRMLIQKVEFFDRYKVGELTGLLTSDLGSVKDIVSENVSRDRGFRALSEIVGTICILFTLSPQLAPILGLLMLVVSILVAVYKRSTMPIFKAHGLAQSSMSDCVSETISAIRTVRSFGGEKRQMSAFGNQIIAYKASGIQLGTYKSINESVTRVAVYVSLLALYCLGGNKVKAGELSVGTVVSFIGYTFTLTFAVQGLVYSFGDLRGAFAAVERINSILSGSETDEALAYGLERQIQPKDVQDEKLQLFVVNGSDEKQRSNHVRYMSALGSSNDVFNVAWSGDISLEDVHFSYPLRPDVEVLKGLNLTLKSGTVTALVGSSGAGKSTIVQLLARFYEPTSGRIAVGGEDVRTFDKSEWARAVSIVNQDPVLFSVSVAENIAYGLPDANVSKDDIVKAAKAANAHEFIISLPQGYDTLVGERGGLLSGGQRQRVAIARALLKNAPVLILDEATSALDTVSERLVQDALNHLMKGRTTLVIAHRLSTVQNAHQIALCSDGRIAELGTHYELSSQNGQYASLVGSQRLAFE